MVNETKIIEFPFDMNWIASVKNGAIVLEKFWETVKVMNEKAANNLSMTDREVRNIHYLNEVFAKWRLPTFSISGEEKVVILPFEHGWILVFEGGEGKLDMFIGALMGLNEIAVSGKNLTEGDKQAVIDINNSLEKSKMPLFIFDIPTDSEERVIPFYPDFQ